MACRMRGRKKDKERQRKTKKENRFEFRDFDRIRCKTVRYAAAWAKHRGGVAHGSDVLTQRSGGTTTLLGRRTLQTGVCRRLARVSRLRYSQRLKHVTGKKQPPSPHNAELQHPFVQRALGYATVGERYPGQHRATRATPGPSKTYTWRGNRAEAQGSAACSGTPPP